MGSIAARHAFAILSLSAKLHSLLDRMNAQSSAENEEYFEDELANALARLEKPKSTVRDEARSETLTLLKKDLSLVEELYHHLQESSALDRAATKRLDVVFETLREKIKEKELTI